MSFQAYFDRNSLSIRRSEKYFQERL